MALHFDGPGPGWLREGLATGFVLLMALAGLAVAQPAGSLACGGLFGAVLFWWLQIAPSNDRDWEPEYARLASVTRNPVHHPQHPQLHLPVGGGYHPGLLRCDL
jgi:hypothetical protein